MRNKQHIRFCPICNNVMAYVNKCNCKFAESVKIKCSLCKKSAWKNNIGESFGKLTIISLVQDYHPIKYECQCDCGNISIILWNSLKRGHTKSCGCLKKINGSAHHLWKDAANIEYKLLCPKCNKERIYTTRQGYKQAMKKNNSCYSCAQSGKICTKDQRQKLSDSQMGHKVSRETRRKLRLSHIKRVEKNKLNSDQMKPNYNPGACKIIDQYGINYNYTFQHAENGGEHYIKDLGYWVDGYDKEKNVVIEYYEKYGHNNKKQKNRDERRMNEIVDYLDCEFIIIYE